ncbi:MAG: S8 family serine peptidase [Verrucomicrobiota bacterium]
MSTLHAATGSSVLRAYPEIDNLTVLALRPGSEPGGVATLYVQSGLVDYAELDYLLEGLAAPNDFRYLDSSLWNLNNTGQLGGKVDADIDAPEGWDVQSTANNIVVAVIDTGARITHEDLAINLWRNPGESGPDLLGLDKSINGIDDDGNGYVDDVHGINALLGTGFPLDDHGHGTHVSGIIGAAGNNSVGIVGVAWRVQLMECKSLDAAGQGSISDAIECINYARAKGAKIINASWGSYTFTSAALRDAINSTRTAGLLFVAACGNDGNNNDVNPLFPASYDLDNIIAVAATTRTDEKATWSNYGAATVDLGAPGLDIFSTWNGHDADYRWLSGTSMAAPHVAGVCALVWARNPNETYLQIKNRVLAATDPIPALSGATVSGGRLNLQKALGASGAVVADFTASPTSGAAPLTVNFTDKSSGNIISRSWDFGDGSPLSSAVNPSHTYQNAGSYKVTLTVTGQGGATSSKSEVITAVSNYEILPTMFSWVDPNGMATLPLSDDGVSGAQTLPFTFDFYGKAYTQLLVGANGLMGFSPPGLSSPANTDLPTSNTPNAAIYPYWADLNPSGGNVRIGVVGSAPNRRVVVSWVNVAPKVGLLTTTRYTFQAILVEGSNQIIFQYQNIQPNRLAGERQSGTVGVENETGTVAAKYTYNENPSTLSNGQALLFTRGATARMSVTPASGLSSSGNVGGPFSPASQTYTVQNVGNAPMNWNAGADKTWVSVSPGSGQLGAGQQTTVTVSINTAANGFGAGTYTASVVFNNLANGDGNTTRPVTLAINQSSIGLLYVIPESGLSSQGSQGGPFHPSSQVYTVTNTGNGTLHWAAAKDREWISLSSTSGTLAPGGSANVTVSINASANQLSPGGYKGHVHFVNTDNGNGNTTRKVNLKVNRPATLSANTAGDGSALGLAAPGLGFPVRVYGDPDAAYMVEATTNLVDWITVGADRPSSSGYFDFVDWQADVFQRRFYRAVNVPADLQPLGALAYRPDRLLVKPKAGIDPALLATLHLITGAQVLQTFPAIGNLQVLQLTRLNLGGAIARYLLSGLVEYAEPDFIVELQATPDDFRYFDGSLWSLNNTGQAGGTADADIDAPEAWDVQTSAASVIIAVIDTGVRFTHEDLAANLWVNSGEVPNNGVDDDNNGVVDDVHGINARANNGNPLDDHGHGSHVSGIMGASGNNGVGVVGVCWQTQIMACKFLDSSGSGSISDAIRCIDYARAMGAKVMNASWGSTGFNSVALQDAIASARDADIIFVAAAGNAAGDNDVDPLFPASYDINNVVSVAATTRNDTLAPFSNYGATTVDVGAPGTPIFSCWNGSDSDYRYLDGTSMATAHVTGICALTRAVYPDENYQQIIQRVLNGVDPLPSLNGKSTSGGRVNLQNALGVAPPPPLPTVTVTATDAAASEEGDAGAFTINRTGSATSPLTVNYAVSGTAGNGTDCQSLPGTVTIPAGAASAVITVTPMDDTAVEGDETVVLTLSADAGYTVGAPSNATVVITDNDQAPPLPTVTVTATDAAASEEGDPGVFTVTRGGSTSAPLTVNYLLSGTAGNGTDYQSLSGTVTIGAGSSAAPVTVMPVDDATLEGDEMVTLTLSADAAYTVGTPGSANVTIADNDQPPPLPTVTVTATDTNASESGDAGSFTVSRTGSTSSSLTVKYFLGGTAGNGVDYQALSGTVDIAAGSSAATVTVTPMDDTALEGDETVTLTLSADTAYTVGSPGSANVTIADNDQPPPLPTVTVTATDTTVSENGDAGSFTVSRSGSTSSALTVKYALSGSASNGSDYQSLSGTAIIAAGAGSATIDVVPIDDTAVEGNETVVFTLASDPAYDVGAPSSATLTITDNDASPLRPVVSVVASDATASESGDPGMFVIVRTGDVAGPLVVSYIAGGTADNGVDYQLLGGTATIPAGASSVAVVVQPLDDPLIELPELVILTLSPSPDYDIGLLGVATVTILDVELLP